MPFIIQYVILYKIVALNRNDLMLLFCYRRGGWKWEKHMLIVG